MKKICGTCNGTGYYDWAEDKSITCSKCNGTGEVTFDPFKWLESWVNEYEKQVNDGKAKEFIDWVYRQPMGR